MAIVFISYAHIDRERAAQVEVSMRFYNGSIQSNEELDGQKSAMTRAIARPKTR